MKLTLIVCTYKRAIPLQRLLASVKVQTRYPDEILIIDGSPDDETKEMIEQQVFKDLRYFQVEPQFRGLTKQRNYGIERVDSSSDIVAFLDDDTVLESDYFENLVTIFEQNDSITGVGGVALNENKWQKQVEGRNYGTRKYYTLEGYVVEEALRNKVRNYLGLQSHLLPGMLPEYSHGKTCGYPLTGKFYEVDLLIGMSMAFRKIVFENLRFSTYFEGYGLYEDADFSIRAQRFGKNVIATNVQLNHYHDPAGRPNQYKYGKMVVRNGWFVWREKYPNPSFKAIVKWHAITWLLLLIRSTNVITTPKRKEAFTETVGRVVGWFSLFLNTPKEKN